MKQLLVGLGLFSLSSFVLAADITMTGGTVTGTDKHFASGTITVSNTTVNNGAVLELNSLGGVILSAGTAVQLGAELKISVKDDDSDGLHDNWETHYLGGTAATAGGDDDNDGLSNLDEFGLGAIPNDADSDDDGFPDGMEVDTGSDLMDQASIPGLNDTTAPSTPTGLTETAKTDLTATISWQAATDYTGVVSYSVFRGGTEVGQTANLSYQDTGLASNTAYSYTVKAKDQAGNTSPASSTLNVTTTNVDQDGDGMDDAWEITHFGNTNQDGIGDFDNDGMNDLDEFLQGGNPTKIEAADTNNDVDLKVVTEGI